MGGEAKRGEGGGRGGEGRGKRGREGVREERGRSGEGSIRAELTAVFPQPRSPRRRMLLLCPESTTSAIISSTWCCTWEPQREAAAVGVLVWKSEDKGSPWTLHK